MSVHLRPYTGADWTAVRDIHDLCKPDETRGSVDPSAVLPFESDAPMLVMFCRSAVTIAVDNDVVVGFAGTIGNYVSWLCVHPEHRRRSVATILLQVALSGVTGPATLNVFARNEPARRLYERLGFFVEQEFIGDFNGQAVDVVRLRRETDRLWFRDEAFWRDYFSVLFPSESFEAAAGHLDRALGLTNVCSGTVLDLCCGPGRYAVPLARKGFHVTAVDRSAFLLQEARTRAAAAGVDIEFVEHDMRSFVRPSSFDVVLSLGNSFGYFDDRDDDLRVLTAIHNNLVPGGWVIIDITCKERESRTARDYVSDLPDGSVCVRRNRPTDDWTRQRHEWLLVRDRTVQRFQFSVHLYSGSELKQFLRNAGFEEARLYGDFDGRPFAGNVNRLVAVARKPIQDDEREQSAQ